MICKHCGAEIPSSANKCKRCGTRIPAKSSCGGFYDLASAGEKLWKDAQPKAPAPVSGGAPVVQYVQDTRQLMILRIVAAVLLVAFLATTITQCCVIGSKNKRVEELERQKTPGIKQEDPAPAEPALADCSTSIHMVLYDNQNFYVSTTVESPSHEDDGQWSAPAVKNPIDVTWEWTLPEAEETETPQMPDEQSPSGSRTVDADELEESTGSSETEETGEPVEPDAPTAPEVEPVNKNYILTVTVTPNPECFGEPAEAPAYKWFIRNIKQNDAKPANWTEVDPENTPGFSTENGVLTCDPEVLGNDLFDLEFRLVYTQTNATGENEQTAGEETPDATAGDLTVAIEGFTCPRPEKDGTQKEDGGDRIDNTN